MGTGSQTARDEERQIIALGYRVEREKLKNRDKEPEKGETKKEQIAIGHRTKKEELKNWDWEQSTEGHWGTKI